PPSPRLSPLSLHDALPISLIPAIGTQQTQRYLLIAAVASGVIALLGAAKSMGGSVAVVVVGILASLGWYGIGPTPGDVIAYGRRSEEHTSELQSLAYLVCR